jgi:hypothetical protein
MTHEFGRCQLEDYRDDDHYEGNDQRLRVEPGDRLIDAPSRGLKTGHIIIALALVAAIAGLLFFTGDEPEPPPPAPEPPRVLEAPTSPTAPEPDLPAAADIPRAAPATDFKPAPAEPATAPQPPPAVTTLEESDPLVREELAAVGGAELLEQVLLNSDLLLRGTGYIEGLSRGLIMNKVLRIAPPGGKFLTIESDGQTVMDPAGYRRYDGYVDAIAGLDTARLASLFHTFRPLLEEAYASSGNPPDDFDNALIRSLDRIIATPEIDQPIPVKKKEAVFLYSDPALEQLAPLQKQLLRTGPDNLRRIKKQARALRARLLAG